MVGRWIRLSDSRGYDPFRGCQIIGREFLELGFGGWGLGDRVWGVACSPGCAKRDPGLRYATPVAYQTRSPIPQTLTDKNVKDVKDVIFCDERLDIVGVLRDGVLLAATRRLGAEERVGGLAQGARIVVVWCSSLNALLFGSLRVAANKTKPSRRGQGCQGAHRKR